MKLGLIGKSLSHSFSKRYFEAKFEKEGLVDHSYHNFELADIDQLTELLKRHPDLHGFNITIPYKTAILPLLHHITEDAQAIGAVNTVKVVEGKLYGYNTDLFGFKQSVLPLLQPWHKSALILGTGGASKAIIHTFSSLGITTKNVSRTPIKKEYSYDQASKDLGDFNIVVNTTPLGTYPNLNEIPDLNLLELSKKHLIYDLIYNPEKTSLLTQAQKQGATIKNGYEMLVLQAEKAWEIWNEM